VLLLAACGSGGALDAKALKQEATTVQSLAAEGAMLASDAAHGKSTKVFTREHAGFLVTGATSSATTLRQSGNAEPLATLAAHVRDDLGRLAHSGGDTASQRRLALTLARAARAAAKLGQRP
jgi:hypothetical protein